MNACAALPFLPPFHQYKWMGGGVVVPYYLEDWYTLDIQNFYKLK